MSCVGGSSFSPRSTTFLGTRPLGLQMLSSLSTPARSGHNPHRIYTSFGNAITGTITSSDSKIIAKRRGEGIEAEQLVYARTTLPLAVLVLGFDDGLVKEPVDRMVLDDAAVGVVTQPASVLGVGAVLPPAS